MNVEKTMAFILEQQAKLVAHQVDVDARFAKIDRRLDGITTILKAGMRWLAKHEQILDRHEKMFAKSRQEFDHRMNALIDAQQRTERKLDRLAEMLLARGPNGRPRSNRA